MTVRAIVVDDEALARRRVVRLLSKHEDIHVIAECGGGRDAVSVIKEKKPDLVFLDVQMPDMGGFEVLQALDPHEIPAVIFVTAYDQYALRAFDACAIDYVMKPYEPGRFAQAVRKAVRWIGTAEGNYHDERIRRLLQDVLRGASAAPLARESGPRIDRFLVRRGRKTEFVRSSEVDWIESDGNYLRLHVGQAGYLVRGTMAECGDRLDPGRFVRIHRRYIVNMDQVQEIQPWFGGDYVVLLRTGAKLRLSRTYRDQFQARMLGG